jgi:methylthioribose-1-phosphate isomerase
MLSYQPIAWHDDHLRLLDQRELPHETTYLDYNEYADVAQSIREMVVRGAPAIGITAGYGMVLAAQSSQAETIDALRDDLRDAADILAAARPTAVNLSYALKRILARAEDPTLDSVTDLREAVLNEAHDIAEAEREANRQMGQNALPLIPQGAKIIHHCNTGPLATGYYGTALGVIYAAHQAGKSVHAFVDETRPRLQGARLTSWELEQMGVPYTVIADGAAAHIMRTRGVALCVVGCDRVAANGDTANKIGTYSLALAAHAHGIPFYVAGPLTTIDLETPTGDAIEIEERPACEITHIGECAITPEGTPVANPAFDVTPARYITAIITERGVARPPFEESLWRMKEET